MKNSQEDKVYVALRSMLQTRILSPDTRERINQALRRVSREAATESLRLVVLEQNNSAAGD